MQVLKRTSRQSLVWIVLASFALASAACKSRSADPAASGVVDAGSPPVVRDDTQGVLFTWIDEKGDFKIAYAIADVPFVGRDAVRVTDPTHDTPANQLWLADLRTTRPDGTYSVRLAARTEFETEAVARRKKNGPTLAGNSRAGDHAATADSADAAARPMVIIYGAEWCSACHDAAAYLKRKGIAFVEKDIEADHMAAREMQAKLNKAGLHGGSIPVLDVRGHVLIGFDPGQLEAALGKPL